MKPGTTTSAEWIEFADPISGLAVRQLTSYKANTHHFYFTNCGWHDEGNKLLISSDRYNRTNLFSIDLRDGSITQITDLEPALKPRELEFLTASLNPRKDEVYFWHARNLCAVDLQTFEVRTLWTIPEGFRPSMTNVTADGKFVCTSISEDLSDRLRIDYQRGYIGFRETFEAHPESRVMRVAVDGSGADVLWKENSWIGHVNTSPARSDLLTFCHEGPWNLVDNRIWGLNLKTGEAWKIRPRTDDESVGHEYWLSDGENASIVPMFCL